MVQELNRCLVCNGDVSPVHFAVHPTEKIACRVCGEYYVSHELAEDGIDSRALRADQRYLFQAWIKRRPLSGQPPPVVTSDSCKSIVQEPQDFSPAEKSEQLLLAYAELCKLPGGTCRAQSRFDFPYAYAQDEAECSEYSSWLVEGELVINTPDGLKLTRYGWERVAQLRRARPASDRACFVAMWFDDSMEDAWTHGPLPGVADAGFEARRLKEEIHADRIDARIVAAIRECRFLVADVSGSRPAVYYEAGFAEGLGKTVIWSCRRGDEDKLCFDTRQFRHIIWSDPTDLRSQLATTIKALMP